MTNFQKKRLEYFKKAAENGSWVRLAKEDLEILNSISKDESVDCEQHDPKEVVKDE